MLFILIATLLLVALSIVATFVVQGGLRTKRRTGPGFRRRLWRRQLVLLPVYVFVVLPGLIGGAGSRLVGTRPDEAEYPGPILTPAGDWVIQNRETLRTAQRATASAASSGTVQPAITIQSPGGPALRAYAIPCRSGRPTAVVVLVHGLFRSAMEVEPIAVMFRDLGADVFLLNLRNHGGSESRPFTFGRNEKDDVLTAVDHLRKSGGLGAPLILFGVSLGAAVAARAAPEIPELRGLVLEAPMTNLVDTAYRQLGRGRGGFGLPAFYVGVVLFYLELWSGFDMNDVRPLDEIAQLPDHLHTLFIGAELDARVPPHVVETALDAHSAPSANKTLWIQAGATHGRVWQKAPQAYSDHLAALLRQLQR